MTQTPEGSRRGSPASPSTIPSEQAAFVEWAAARAHRWAPSATRCRGYAEPADVVAEVLLRFLCRRHGLPAFVSASQALAYARQAAFRVATSMWRRTRRVHASDVFGSDELPSSRLLGVGGASRRHAWGSLPLAVDRRMELRRSLTDFARRAPRSEREALVGLSGSRPEGGNLTPAQRAARLRARRRLETLLGPEAPSTQQEASNGTHRPRRPRPRRARRARVAAPRAGRGVRDRDRQDDLRARRPPGGLGASLRPGRGLAA